MSSGSGSAIPVRELLSGYGFRLLTAAVVGAACLLAISSCTGASDDLVGERPANPDDQIEGDPGSSPTESTAVLDAAGGTGDSSSTQSVPVTECDGGGRNIETLNSFVRLMDERYAVFPQRLSGTSWGALAREACARVQADDGSDTLYDAMLNMVRVLDDGHTSIDNGDQDLDGWSGYPDQRAVERARELVEASYADGGRLVEPDDADGHFAYGTIDDGRVGYISITSMECLSRRCGERSDIDAASEAMAEIAAALDQTELVVLDVRSNEGGWDFLGLEVASWFDGDSQVAWRKASRDGPAHSDYGDFKATDAPAGRDRALSQCVVVLQSGYTFSAAETFLLAMRTRSSVVFVGEPSSGHLSDLYDHELPNGWDMTYSGDLYQSADGDVFEAVGVPVDVALPFDGTAADEGVDTMLEAVLNGAAERNARCS